MIEIEIHEFSTGIIVEGNKDNWFSLGFTGQYMNSTLSKIPNLVQEAISNREFAVAEKTSDDNPGLIARELKNQDEEWSVIAVITRAKDDFGRYLPVYRYFLSEGIGKLEGILRWMNNKPPIFNPFELQNIDQPHNFNYDETNRIPIDNFTNYFSEEIPLLIPANVRCNPLIINSIATKKAKKNLLAWAYNVGGLEIINSFYVIYPADEQVENKLRQIIANLPSRNKIIVGGEGVKKAISGLISKEKAKLEYLQTLENALSNSDFDEEYWREIFDGRGAENALKQDLYSETMVRLLTLRAIALPNTLPQFLLWMARRKTKNQEHWHISTSFQVSLAQTLHPISEIAPYFASKIEQGVKFLLLTLLEQPELLNQVTCLFKDKCSIWANFYHQNIKKYLETDLTLINQFIHLQENEAAEKLEFNLKKEPTWELIFNELLNFWPPNYQTFTLNKYYPWAKLFEALQDYHLAAIFYQISTDEVPKSVFSQICTSNSRKKLTTEIYGLTIYRKTDFLETIMINLT